MTLPQWMREAIKDRVINEAEAQEIHQIVKASDQEEVLMPDHLYPVMQRIYLWELPVSQTVH